MLEANSHFLNNGFSLDIAKGWGYDGFSAVQTYLEPFATRLVFDFVCRGRCRILTTTYKALGLDPLALLLLLQPALRNFPKIFQAVL